MYFVNSVKILIWLLIALVISTATPLTFLASLLITPIIFRVARWVFCYYCREIGFSRSMVNGYVTYLQQGFITLVIRLIMPQAGWYLYMKFGAFDRKEHVSGPYVSILSADIRRALNRAREGGSTPMPARTKFQLQAPDNTQTQIEENYF